MKKYIILIVLCCAYILPTFAQSYTQNLQRYWWYRYRLANDFIKIGDKCGESIPAGERILSTWGNTETAYDANDGKHHLQWGDATIDLAEYMGVLATEYRLLKNNNRSTARTEMEIYYALKAFERLDLNAEEHMRDFENTKDCNNINPHVNQPNIFQNDYNGFFIRDDVPNGFVQNNYNHFNRKGVCNIMPGENSTINVRANGFVWDDNTNQFLDWNSLYPNTPQYPVEESQDQHGQLFIGLSLLVELLDNNVYYWSYNLKDKAAHNLYRMNKWAMITGNIPSPSGGYHLKNPLNLICPYGDHPELYNGLTHCNEGGAEQITNLFPMFWGMWENEISYPASGQLAFLIGLTPVFSAPSIPQLVFQFSKYFPTLPPYCYDYNWDAVSFPMSYEVVAKKWRIGVWPASVNVSRYFINKQSTKCDYRYMHFPMLYRLFHNGPLPDQNATILNNLNIAPKCGPYLYMDANNFPSIFENFEWSSQDRIQSAYKRGPHPHVPEGDFNGLDYMLLFNLYCLNNNSYPQYYVNPYYAVASDMAPVYPHLPAWVGSHATPVYFKSLEYNSCTSTINPDGEVEVRNAKQIELLPGFHAKLGSTFLGYIKDYQCCPNTSDEEQPNKPPEEDFGFWIDSTNNDEYVGHELPIDTVPDYEPTADEMAADSIALWDQIILANDTMPGLLDYVNGLFGISSTQQRGANTIEETKNIKLVDYITLFPNPSNGYLTIQVPKQTGYSIKVFNTLGETVFEKIVENNYTYSIDLSFLNSGNYIIQFINDKESSIKKINIIK
jgi:hypothetical protein